jgi:hypothetical protein
MPVDATNKPWYSFTDASLANVLAHLKNQRLKPEHCFIFHDDTADDLYVAVYWQQGNQN